MLPLRIVREQVTVCRMRMALHPTLTVGPQRQVILGEAIAIPFS